MDRPSYDFDPSRRRLLKQAGAVALPLALPACGGGGGPASETVQAEPQPPGTPVDPQPAGTAPAVTSQPASSQVRVGQPATFTVAADGTAPLSYQWLRDGVAACADGGFDDHHSRFDVDHGGCGLRDWRRPWRLPFHPLPVWSPARAADCGNAWPVAV